MGQTIKPGNIIGDRYEIKGVLGEGGMSVVYRGIDKQNKQEIAIKVLKQGVTSSYVEDVIRFKKEAETISKFNHPHVIKLYGAGEYKNTPYLVEALIEGDSLSDLLYKGKHFLPKEIITIMIQIAGALDYVHSRGIIHRDLKPGNIMLDKNSKKIDVKLLDFGVAHVMELTKIKEKEEIVGTFGYMSPEATGIMNKKIDERSDFYSLGIVFYRLLSGELPFKSTEVSKLLHEQVAVEAQKLTKIDHPCAGMINEVIQKLMNKEPELRYQSAKGLIYDLERIEKSEKQFIIGEKDQKLKLTYQTRLVGREEDMEKLKWTYQRARKGEGSVMLVGGDPGVGKTRLVEAFKDYLYEQGYEGGGLFIQGRCLNQENKT
ncbi:MAG: serine/threonine-protein kinase PknK, partial [Spirochaetes bacterium]|nr:serine/threonine-protein kinase PknK [Spirochaetota bacterium]